DRHPAHRPRQVAALAQAGAVGARRHACRARAGIGAADGAALCRPRPRALEADRAHSKGGDVMGKSIWAVVAGVLVIIIGSTLVDVVLHALHIFPPWNQPIDDKLAALATSYRVIISIAGAWLTARLAPQNPMRHAMALGYVGTALGLIGVIA